MFVLVSRSWKSSLLGFLCFKKEDVGWKIQKENEGEMERVCPEIGVSRQVMKVWMHNNKHTMNPRNNSIMIINRCCSINNCMSSSSMNMNMQESKGIDKEEVLYDGLTSQFIELPNSESEPTGGNEPSGRPNHKSCSVGRIGTRSNIPPPPGGLSGSAASLPIKLSIFIYITLPTGPATGHLLRLAFRTSPPWKGGVCRPSPKGVPTLTFSQEDSRQNDGLCGVHLTFLSPSPKGVLRMAFDT